ncbi:C4-type zinc ribbon domain-containing protein, partial [Chloroflexota bacterium]
GSVLKCSGSGQDNCVGCQALKKQKGTAIANVEQGICRGCRILLPITELQRARSSSLVRCSSCGRILFLA